MRMLVRNKCGFSSGVCVSSEGNAGGMGFWWQDMEVRTVSFSAHHFAVEVLDTGGNATWRAVGVYGWPERDKKFRTWD